jgi:agmatine deiminase
MRLITKLGALALILTISAASYAQTQPVDLPQGYAAGEENLLPSYNALRQGSSRGITTAPNFDVRTMAEWEEIQSLVVTWTSYPDVLTEIVRHAKLECEVIIICSNPTQVTNTLAAAGVDTQNITFLIASYDSVWMRDYGGNTVYENDVDSLYMVDWIYNRPRPDDDVTPTEVTNLKGITLYETTVAPSDLVNTGGNWMVDGWGTAFASNLILEENEPGNPYNVTAKTEQEIDDIMLEWMGIDRYIKMEVLPFDGIHHIDMHMKLLDEETLIMGEYPAGVADGPQIEANMQYVLSNFNSIWGDPYDVIRIEMPPENGVYPDEDPWWDAGAYRTYTNSVFINGTVLVPFYEEEWDTTAQRIYEEALPGYTVVGIECNDIIQASGAIHCITHSIGVNDPLWISHQSLNDTYDVQNAYTVDAMMKHRSGIQIATMYWTTDVAAGYTAVPMTATTNDFFTADIPAQAIGTQVFYYVEGEAFSGKQQVRPIVAPTGYWEFRVLQLGVGVEELQGANLMSVFPNPASAITCIPLSTSEAMEGTLKLYDVAGKEMETIHSGTFVQGESKYFFRASEYPAGAYFVVLETADHKQTQQVMIQ